MGNSMATPSADSSTSATTVDLTASPGPAASGGPGRRRAAERRAPLGAGARPTKMAVYDSSSSSSSSDEEIMLGLSRKSPAAAGKKKSSIGSGIGGGISKAKKGSGIGASATGGGPARRARPTHSSPRITVSDLSKTKKKKPAANAGNAGNKGTNGKGGKAGPEGKKPLGKPVNNKAANKAAKKPTKGKGRNDENTENQSSKRKKAPAGRKRQVRGGKQQSRRGYAKLALSDSSDSSGSSEEEEEEVAPKKRQRKQQQGAAAAKKGGGKRNAKRQARYGTAHLVDTDDEGSGEDDEVMVVEETEAKERRSDKTKRAKKVSLDGDSQGRELVDVGGSGRTQNKQQRQTEQSGRPDGKIQVLPPRILAVDNRALPTPIDTNTEEAIFTNHPEAKVPGQWDCSVCTFVNKDPRYLACFACNAVKTEEQAPDAPLSHGASLDTKKRTADSTAERCKNAPKKQKSSPIALQSNRRSDEIERLKGLLAQSEGDCTAKDNKIRELRERIRKDGQVRLDRAGHTALLAQKNEEIWRLEERLESDKTAKESRSARDIAAKDGKIKSLEEQIRLVKEGRESDNAAKNAEIKSLEEQIRVLKEGKNSDNAAKDGKIKSLERILASKGDEIQVRDRDIASKDGKIKSLQEQVRLVREGQESDNAAKDAEIERLERVLASNGNEIQVRDRDIASKDGKIKTLEEQIRLVKEGRESDNADKNREIECLEQNLADSSEQIRELKEDWARDVTAKESNAQRLREENQVVTNALCKLQALKEDQDRVIVAKDEKIKNLEKNLADKDDENRMMKYDCAAKDKKISGLGRCIQKYQAKASESECEVSDDETVKIRRNLESQLLVETPCVHWDDIVGNKLAKEDLMNLPVCRRNYYQFLFRYDDPDKKASGILLHGPPGTGKTMLAKAVATATKGRFIMVKPQDILNELIGGTESRMSAVFDIATTHSIKSQQPTIIFLDEVDGLLGKTRHNDSKAETNIIKIFQMFVDGAQECEGDVIVLAATNFRENLPAAVLSRFGNQILLDLPNTEDIIDILKLNLQKRMACTHLSENEYRRLAEEMKLEGASGRDVWHLVDNTVKRVTFLTSKSDFWCRDKQGYYVPCFHEGTANCGRERKSIDDVAGNARLPPLSFEHFDDAIATYGIKCDKEN